MTIDGAKSGLSLVWRVVVALLVFGGSATAVMTLDLPGTPHAESDRWAVAMAVAGFLGGLTIGAFEWSRRRGGSDGVAGSSTQWVRTGRGSETIVAGGDVNTTGTAAPRAAKSHAPVDQRVKSGRRSRNIVAGGNVTTRQEKRK